MGWLVGGWVGMGVADGRKGAEQGAAGQLSMSWVVMHVPPVHLCTTVCGHLAIRPASCFPPFPGCICWLCGSLLRAMPSHRKPSQQQAVHSSQHHNAPPPSRQAYWPLHGRGPGQAAWAGHWALAGADGRQQPQPQN